MNCVACGAPQPEPAPRFCDSCGLATGRVPPRAAQARSAKAEPPVVRCQECGVVAESRRCRGCGARVRWPEDVVPPDEAELGTGPAPALELPDLGDGDGLEIDAEGFAGGDGYGHEDR